MHSDFGEVKIIHTKVNQRQKSMERRAKQNVASTTAKSMETKRKTIEYNIEMITKLMDEPT